ncbi:uncharacterized protein HMPREF1541_03588 [Cyphellophora europaea CBS 101466]|uniref:F-box domain-containing protein n=1 Tax=Cyphellophora europaea (strain CBS 101466) TaxID=1220924 RepID=W2RYX1_CYPE1|nr:uncharacterized protein HMPREF1541_03588 [Cyphellophora europaea CBS 101466]ETN41652.1 hypothetical protein HMPREF1541_03588 [Cyphellophora europaea CBS 101466]
MQEARRLDDEKHQELREENLVHLISEGASNAGDGSSVASSIQLEETDLASVTTSEADKSKSEYSIVYPVPAPPKRHKKASRRLDGAVSDDEPLVDKTAALTLKSKKLARRQKKQAKKRVETSIHTMLDLPHEVLTHILSYLKPTDMFTLLRVSRSVNEVIQDNESNIAAAIISHRYRFLSQCFPPPVPLASVPAQAHSALLSERWQHLVRIHRFSYQQITQVADPALVCSCTACVLAWNNLNTILDLAHWQYNLAHREPLPIIPRGQKPDWNTKLLSNHAEIVTRAMYHPLTYLAILQIHLDTTTSTILRSSRWRRKGENPNIVKPRLYGLTDTEAESGTDTYLARKGRENFNPIYMRDQYYTTEVWMPNRKWDREEERWRYYAKPQHENDVKWIQERFTPTE